MLLNVSKNEITFFSRDNREASWRPTALLNGLPMPFNETPKFLGVYLDRSLNFGQHIEQVTKKGDLSVQHSVSSCQQVVGLDHI